MRKSHKLVEGVGITDVTYSPVATKCPYYSVWQSMLKRCYNQSFLIKNPTYAGCSVNTSWHSFNTFKEWMQGQDWKDKQLDKDIRVPGNKIYGPDTCLFVSHHINGLLCTQPNSRGDLPIGVVRHGLKFKAGLKKNRKTTHIGVYASQEAAAHAYRIAKADWVEECAVKEQCSVTRAALLSAALTYRNQS